MANQLWTELNDQQAELVSGGNKGQEIVSVGAKQIKEDFSDPDLFFPPSVPVIQAYYDNQSPKNFGQILVTGF